MTTLDLAPRRIRLNPGDEMIGYRLRPGLQVDVRHMTASDVTGVIADASQKQTDLSDAIAALGTDGTSANKIAKQLGVSLRTFQRQLARCDLPPPDFWRLLGRARRAAIALGSDQSIADIAAQHGFSDQAHMTRACQHWFRLTPRCIQKTACIRNDIAQPALGTWAVS